MVNTTAASTKGSREVAWYTVRYAEESRSHEEDRERLLSGEKVERSGKKLGLTWHGHTSKMLRRSLDPLS
jgi:hypothetical protein